MEDRLYLHAPGHRTSWRRADPRMAVGLLVAAIAGVALWLVLSSKPTPTASGLREIPRSALAQLNTRLGTGRRFRFAGAIQTHLLTGAVVLGRHDGKLRLEVSTQDYTSPTDWPFKSPRPVNAAPTEDYKVVLLRTSKDKWQVANVKWVPIHFVHEG
jgi:hypothetical protein